jgi:hypothetical protein
MKKYLKTNALFFALHYSVVKCSEDLLKIRKICCFVTIAASPYLPDYSSYICKKKVILLLVHTCMDSSLYPVTSASCLSVSILHYCVICVRYINGLNLHILSIKDLMFSIIVFADGFTMSCVGQSN